jgi:hypothetical protein
MIGVGKRRYHKPAIALADPIYSHAPRLAQFGSTINA